VTASAVLRPVRNPRTRTPRSPLQRWFRRHERAALGFAGVVGFIGFWELGSRAGVIDAFFFSRPSAIVAAGIAEVQLPRFWTDVRVSAWEFASGYLAAVALAIPIGLAFGWYRRLSYMADPWLNLLNSLPRVALLPLISLWLGIGIESKIAVVFLGAFFSVVIPTVQGVRTVDRRFLDVARSFGASQRRLFTSVVMPGTVPFIVTGLRLGVGRGLIGVVVAELFGSRAGLGRLISQAADSFNMPELFAGVVILAAAGIAMTAGFTWLERRLVPWTRE
jgi:NitT/TauT family transport system permease protein